MNRDETVAYLTRVGEVRKAWGEAHTSVTADIFTLMNRMLHEAAVNRLSVEDVANLTGFTKGRLRVMMRNIGMNPKASRSLLSKQSATALAENATLLGIEPSEMDLMSPLAYLPMGSQMRRELADQSVSKVTDVDGVSGNLCTATHPRMTVVSRCLEQGEHEMHRGACGDEYGTLVLWANR